MSDPPLGSLDLQLSIGLYQVEVCAWAATTLLRSIPALYEPLYGFSADLHLPIGLNQVEVCAWAATTMSLYISPCRLASSNRVNSGRGLCLGCYYPAEEYSCSVCEAPLCGPQCENKSDHVQVN
jgi:hypothetical protein